MKYIQTYEELKYTKYHIKLIAKVRYALNKYFGKKCCGVSKVRYDPFTKNYELTPYNGNTMLFDISLPSYLRTDIEDYDLKIKYFSELAKKLNLTKEYETLNTDYILTEEQMEELLKNIPHIKMEIDMVKYNI